MPNITTPAIRDLLTPETVKVGLVAADKKEALQHLVALLADHPAVRDLLEIHRAVDDRESRMSTGVGLGLGLPHAKTAAVTETMAAFAVTRDPLPFDAIDGQPVRLLFLLVGPPEANPLHIRILARLSRLMNHADLRDQFIRATSAADLLATLENAEHTLLDSI